MVNLRECGHPVLRGTSALFPGSFEKAKEVERSSNRRVVVSRHFFPSISSVSTEQYRIEAKKRWSMKQGIRAETFILRHWWTFCHFKNSELEPPTGLVSHKLMPETLRFPQSKRSSYCCTWSMDFSSLRSLPQFVEQEYQPTAYANIQVHTAYPSIQVHTAYPSIQVHTATDALAVYDTVLQFCQSLPTSSCRYNSSDLWVVHASSPEPWILAT